MLGIAFSASLALAGCGQPAPARVFASHVYAGPDVELLRSERTRCMHCPYFFALRAGPSALEAIIERHRLRASDAMPECLESGHALGTRSFPWWRAGDGAKVFGACYRAKEAGQESQFRMLIVSQDQALFATSLCFAERDYERIR